MKEPYFTLWMNLVAQHNFQRGRWSDDVKWTGSAFYIGTDAEHITILEGTAGFHHSFDEDGQHVTRSQHLNAVTIQNIIDHINHNQGAYKEPRILAKLQAL